MAAENETPVTSPRRRYLARDRRCPTPSCSSSHGKNFRNYESRATWSEITVEPGLDFGRSQQTVASAQSKGRSRDSVQDGTGSVIHRFLHDWRAAANNSACAGARPSKTPSLYVYAHRLRRRYPCSIPGIKRAETPSCARTSISRSRSSRSRSTRAIGRGAHRSSHQEEVCHQVRRAGYSINALVDHDVNDPIEIIKRLMIGSEGTLGFVSQATYKTVVDHPHKASFIYRLSRRRGRQ